MEKNKSNPDYFTEVQESSNKERHEGVDTTFMQIQVKETVRWWSKVWTIKRM